MNPYRIKFITFENLFREYTLYAKNEDDVAWATKKVFPRLSEILSIEKIEVK